MLDIAVFIDPQESDALATAVAELLASDERRKALGAKGVEHARGFTWERTARLTVEAYRSAAE